MIQISVKNDFADWRAKARRLLQHGIPPGEILWTSAAQNSLFEEDFTERNKSAFFKVPAEFLSLAEMVACHDDAERWSLLYRLLFRLLHENRNLLHIESDADVRTARLMEKGVSRDVHKFHAFVRFRRAEYGGGEIFIAWHEPHHFTVKLAAPFFVRRFGEMRFSILTPKGCAHWDLKNLIFTEGVEKNLAPQTDETEDFWLTYYQAIFNPFRLKIKAMRAEFPVRHWRTLPEAKLIPKLIRDAQDLRK